MAASSAERAALLQPTSASSTSRLTDFAIVIRQNITFYDLSHDLESLMKHNLSLLAIEIAFSGLLIPLEKCQLDSNHDSDLFIH